MIGNVIAPFEGVVPPFNPDDYFDPTTHTATEENFIALLNDGIYIEDVIGYKVTLSNNSTYNNGTWIIADVNHDSANTGQTNCYDLISEGCFESMKFNRIINSWRQGECFPRSWLNNTFFEGFPANRIRPHILNIKYNSAGTWYNDDKIILPSKIEVNLGTDTTNDVGTPYPIFTDNTSRIKRRNNSGSPMNWFTRSANPNNGSSVWYIYGDGTCGQVGYDSYSNPVALIRVS